MIIQIETSQPMPYVIIKAVNKIETKVGIAIVVLEENKTYILRKNKEIEKYCHKQGEDVFDISSMKLKEPEMYKHGKSTICIGLFHKEKYVYTSEGIFFPLETMEYYKLVEKLKPKIVMLNTGEIKDQANAFISDIML